MNSNYTEHNFPPIKAQNWNSLFPEKQNEDFISLISIVLKYEPNSRPSAIEAMCHPFFNELRSNDCKLLSDKPLPPLFNFSKLELAIRPDLVKMLRPNTGADSVSAPVKAECP
ncbi:regulator of ime2 [Coelomomyces lativittatus]|nr:regulator of ime2 [Coelomomyces lativittatus]